MKPLDYQQLTLPAASGQGAALVPGVVKSQLAGSFFFCKSASRQFQMQFDAGTQFPCEAGFFTNGDVATFNSITFLNFNSTAITLTFYVGTAGVGYAGTLLSKNLSTYALGNLGLAGAPLQTSGTFKGFIKLASGGSSIAIPGTNSGNLRKYLIISVYYQLTGVSGGDLLDSAGGYFCNFDPGTKLVFETDSDFVFKNDNANDCYVKIGQLFYAA